MALVEAKIASLMADISDRSEYVSLVKMQQMVRCTVLECMGGAPAQVEAYRQEVLELQTLVKGYLGEVRELRAERQRSDDTSSDTASLADHSVPASPCGLEPLPAAPAAPQLGVAFEVEPTSTWYEHKPLPRFAVRVTAADGAPHAGAALTLRVSMLNGRGIPEEQRASGAGELLAGEATAPVVDGVASWEALRVCEPSSKHYGAFTMRITAHAAGAAGAAGAALAELRSAPLQIQVGRMWSKRRKSVAELGAADPISQIPGVGARYISRLQLHGVDTVGTFAAMAGTPAGKEALCKLCKGDNPRNSLNAAKLDAMIETAQRVMRASAGKRARDDGAGGDADADADAPPAKAAATRCRVPMHSMPADVLGAPGGLAPVDAESGEALGLGGELEAIGLEPSFSLDELLLLSSDDANAGRAGLGGLGGLGEAEPPMGGFGLGAEDETEVRMRRLDMGGGAAAAAASAPLFSVLPPKPSSKVAPSFSIMAPKQSAFDDGAVGMRAFDALCGGGGAAAAPSAPLARPPLAPKRAPTAALVGAAWRGDGEALSAMADAGVPAAGADRYGCSALHVAALGGHAALVSTLLGAPTPPGIDDGAAGIGGATPLLLAASRGAAGEAACAALLDAGADARCTAHGAVSAMHLAAWAGAPGALRRLVGAAPHMAAALSAVGLTPLDYACLGGHVACVEVLLAAGAPSGAALPALHCAALRGAEEVVCRLLAALPEQQGAASSAGWLPIHCAAASAAPAALRQLLATGAVDALAATADGSTALDLACAGGHLECAALLVAAAAGAPPAAASLLCAVGCAAPEGLDCVALLLEHCAEPGPANLPAAVRRLHGAEAAERLSGALLGGGR